MIKEYWDDVDSGSGPNRVASDDANVMVERPTLYALLPQDMSKTTTLAVGCDDHEPALEAARRGSHLVVVDPSEEALDNMFQALAQEGLSADLVVSSPNDLKAIPDESVELVTAGNTIGQIENLLPVVSEFHRVVKPGGAVLMIVSHPLVSGGHMFTGGMGVSQWLLDDYFSSTRELRQRTVESYINPLIQAGFAIERLMEPQPDPKTKGVNNTSWNLFNRIPQLLVLTARKRA